MTWGGPNSEYFSICYLFAQLLVQGQINGNIQLRITGLCAGNSPVTGEFPAQKASDAENVPIWWRHHAPCGISILGRAVENGWVLQELWSLLLRKDTKKELGNLHNSDQRWLENVGIGGGSTGMRPHGGNWASLTASTIHLFTWVQMMYSIFGSQYIWSHFIFPQDFLGIS